MKLLATVAIVTLLILTIEAQGGGHKGKGGGHRHHKHHGLRACDNGTCRQPCELRNCDTGKVCVEHTFTCHSDNSVKTISRCRNDNNRYRQKCNCVTNQICVFNKRHTTCRVMLVNVQPVDTSEPLCPGQKNNNGRGQRKGRFIQRVHMPENWKSSTKGYYPPAGYRPPSGYKPPMGYRPPRPPGGYRPPNGYRPPQGYKPPTGYLP